MTMRVSELIAGLQNMLKAYGDLPVAVSLALKEEPKIVSDDNLLLVYNQITVDEEEITLQNYLY